MQYAPVHSHIDIEFWSLLSHKILHDNVLNQPIKTIYASYTTPKSPSTTTQLHITNSAFDRPTGVPGQLITCSTAEQFSAYNTASLVNEYRHTLWHAICSADISQCITLLTQFIMVNFSDLKTHIHHYIICVPQLVLPADVLQYSITQTQPIDTRMSTGCLTSTITQINTLLQQHASPYFILVQHQLTGQYGYATLGATEYYTVHQLSEYTKIVANNDPKYNKLIFGCIDTINDTATHTHLLRNLITFLAVALQLHAADVLLYRDQTTTAGSAPLSTVLSFALSSPYNSNVNTAAAPPIKDTASTGQHSFMVFNSKFTIETRYLPTKLLGHGALGVVCGATDQVSGRKVAIKKMYAVFDDIHDAKRVLREVKLLRHFHHENIVGLRDLCGPNDTATPFNDVYLVLDHMETDLHKIIYSKNELTDEHIQYFIYQILKAVKYMHSWQISHGNLTPSNVLLNSDCDLKICDFGVACSFAEPAFGEHVSESIIRRNRAPEIMCACDGTDGQADVWSVGCILAELLGRKPLFGADDYIKHMNQIFDTIGTPDADADLSFLNNAKALDYVKHLTQRQKKQWSTVFPDISLQALDLLDKMLVFNPNSRITVNDALAHPYLQRLHKTTPDPPSRQPFTFEYEQNISNRDDVRRMMMQEVLQYRPQFAVNGVTQATSAGKPSTTSHSTTLSDNTMHNSPPRTGTRSTALSIAPSTPSFSTTPIDSIKVVGWERNKHGKIGPRSVDLGKLMNPLLLAESSINLNLQLMKWRLLPDVKLDTIQSSKCLLLGAGTLGCNVARCLLGWGIQHITLVDNGKVSFSNPVRQSLFTYEDCLNGGKPKATAAAAALKRIYPQLNATGVQMTIPMAGHHVNDSELQATIESVKQLIQLIANHDIIFLLTDSRESRWLPTVICKSMSKLCINTALGFDTYVVMRHGNTPPADGANSGNSAGIELGCYFCNDVIAPVNSLRDRTLDQQCTVTRPGISYIASADAVELAVACLHHPLRQHAPAITAETEPLMCGFGTLPHTLRGYMSRFEQRCVVGEAMAECVGCSKSIVAEYDSRGVDFVLDALNRPSSYLEGMSGLTAMKDAAERMLSQPDMQIDGEEGEDGDDW